MDEQELSYALAKQVPDMARGFTIHTNYGDIVIEAGWVAGIVSLHLERSLKVELRELLAKPKQTPEPAKAAAAPDYFDRMLMGAKP